MTDDSIVDHVLKERYYQPGETCWEDIATRVSKFIADNFEEQTSFEEAIKSKKLIPASPFLMNAGTVNPQLFSCFVLPIEDNIDSIFKFYSDSAKIFKSSGGVGADWSLLRPKGAPLSGGGETSGVVSFTKIFDRVIETVKQGGIKKGAAICCLNIDHPEIEDFIKMKLERGECENFNISPCVTDDFMERVENGDAEANNLFNLITYCAWESSEPGLLFIDTANKDSSTPGLGRYTSPNPCSERFLLSFESCCLSGINLIKFINDDKSIDYNSLEKVVRVAVRFLDNAIDKNKYPLPEIERATKYTRRIGIYPIGVADVLLKVGLPYNSNDGRMFCEFIWKFINEIAWDESIRIGRIKGPFEAILYRDHSSVHERSRNAAVTCCAPSGTTSIIAGSNFGIEPFFSFVSKRSKGSGQGMIINEQFKDMVYKHYPNKVDEIIEECYKNGSIQHLSWIKEDMRNVFVSAHDISWKDHIDMQAMFQKHCKDGSISKSINVPESTSINDIRNMFIYAWKSGCKGVTIYREGSRDGVYTLKEKDEVISTITELVNPVTYKLVNANGRILPKTPRETPATMYKKNTGCGKMMIAVGEVDGKPHSITIVNKGGCDAMTQGLAELTSLCERYGVPQWNINKVLMGVKCSAAMRNIKSDGRSCPEILGKILHDHYPHEDEPPKTDDPPIKKEIIEQKANACPQCGESLIHASGCVSCSSCSYSRCS